MFHKFPLSSSFTAHTGETHILKLVDLTEEMPEITHILKLVDLTEEMPEITHTLFDPTCETGMTLNTR